MAHVAPVGSDIASLLFETCSDALETGILVLSKDDVILATSRNLGSFFPVSEQFLQRGTSLRSFLTALFEIGFAAETAGGGAKGATSRDEWLADRIATMWHERGEALERVGREKWLALTTRRLASGHGIVMVRDVSARRKTEERWKSDMERVALTEEILDNLPVMLFVLDRNLSFVAVNKAFSRPYGLPPEAILDRPLRDVIDPEMEAQFTDAVRQTLATGRSGEAAFDIVDDGLSARHRLQCVRLGRPGNHFIVGVLSPLAEAIEETAHELDSAAPLLSYIQEQDLPFEGRRERFVTAPSADSSVLILSGDAAYGEALTEAMVAFRFDACRATDIDEAAAIVEAARQAGIAVDLVMADDADAGAAAFEGLDVKVLPVSRARPVHFAVAEAAAVLARNADKRPSPLDTDYLPDFPVPDRLPDPAGFGVELLVVEDNPINQEVYAQILGGLGVSYELAKDGAEAVRLWDVLRPPLILMDIDLPIIDGFAATRQIRAAEAGCAHPAQIVGVMARSSDEQHASCLRAGMDRTIVKPLSVEVLDALYRQYVLSALDVEAAQAFVR